MLYLPKHSVATRSIKGSELFTPHHPYLIKQQEAASSHTKVDGADEKEGCMIAFTVNTFFRCCVRWILGFNKLTGIFSRYPVSTRLVLTPQRKNPITLFDTLNSRSRFSFKLRKIVHHTYY